MLSCIENSQRQGRDWALLKAEGLPRNYESICCLIDSVCALIWCWCDQLSEVEVEAQDDDDDDDDGHRNNKIDFPDVMMHSKNDVRGLITPVLGWQVLWLNWLGRTAASARLGDVMIRLRAVMGSIDIFLKQRCCRSLPTFNFCPLTRRHFFLDLSSAIQAPHPPF